MKLRNVLPPPASFAGNTLITVFNLDTQNSLDSKVVWSRVIVVTSPPPMVSWVQN